jgi:hypothetical protein
MIAKRLKKASIPEKKSDVETLFLTKPDIKRAKQFVQARVNDNVELYKRRGGFKEVDILSGALAEIAVYKLLKSKGFPVGKPDFTIHEVRKKSFDPDLFDGLHHFHVKGQTLESKALYGASWIMQRTDPIINSPQRLHYMVPCTVDTDTGRVEIYGVMSIMSLVQNGCIGECKNAWFQKTKVAIYLDHIEGILSKAARWGFVRTGLSRLEE